jgi:hypothetical protein
MDTDEADPRGSRQGNGDLHGLGANDHSHAVFAVQARSAWRNLVNRERRPRIHQAQSKPLGVDGDAGDAVAIEASQIRLDQQSATMSMRSGRNRSKMAAVKPRRRNVRMVEAIMIPQGSVGCAPEAASRIGERGWFNRPAIFSSPTPGRGS